MSYKNRQSYFDLHAEIGIIIADLNYWVKEFSPQVEIDFKKKWTAIKEYPKEIYCWNEKVKGLLKTNELFGSFIKDDEKIVKLNDIKIKDDSDLDFYAFNDLPHFEDGKYHPSDYEKLINCLDNKRKVIEKIIENFPTKQLSKKSANRIILIKEEKKCVLKLSDKELKISYVSKGGQSLQSILLIKMFSNPRKEYKAGSTVSWDELAEKDYANDVVFSKDQIKNAIFDLNQKSVGKLGISLFNWNNGDIKILI